jgi:hypothetical protein
MISFITFVISIVVALLTFGHTDGVYSFESVGAAVLGVTIGWLLLDEVTKRIKKENE